MCVPMPVIKYFAFNVPVSSRFGGHVNGETAPGFQAAGRESSAKGQRTVPGYDQ